MEKGKIFERLNLIMQDVSHIEKGKAAGGGLNYAFRGIDDMYNELHSHFVKHKVFLTSEVINSVREERQNGKGTVLIYSVLDIRFTFYAEDGSNVSSVMRGEAMDSGDKASNKAASAALKYALMQLFLIPTKEEGKDTEEENPKPLPKAGVKPLNSLATETQKALIEVYTKVIGIDANIQNKIEANWQIMTVEQADIVINKLSEKYGVKSLSKEQEAA